MKIALFVSGALGLHVLKELFAKRELIAVFTDKNSAGIIGFCQTRSLLLFVGNPRHESAAIFAENLEFDVLISANYIFLLDSKILQIPRLLAFNLHGSLLPKYRGRTPHVWAIINGESSCGITAHVIDQGCDTGDIIAQVETPIGINTTGADILETYQDMYPALIENILIDIDRGLINRRPQDSSRATYFGKRTEQDGLINWNWQRERIHNWIRAQAFPYPGAYSFVQGNRIIIDRVHFADTGYSYDMPNGLILSVDPICVKTPNGVLEISSIRNTSNLLISRYDIFE